jgi:hypothetical protein
LKELLAEAAVVLKNDPDGVLSLGYREMIWGHLGPNAPKPVVRPLTPGHLRRIRLVVLSVQHVLPLWLQAQPSDTSVQDSLSLILRGLAETGREEDLQRLANEHWETGEGSDETLATFVHAAASRAIVTFLEDETFDPDEYDPDMADAAMDAYDHDAAFWASCVAADGATWSETSDAGKRRAYWTWWLEEAVPKAWSAVP